MKVNLMGIGLEGFVNIDICHKADKVVDLEKKKIPLKDNSVDELLYMSGINYLTKERAQFIIKDVYRVLKKDGVCRFGVQDLEIICKQYLFGDPDFNCERINSWFGNDEKFAIKGIFYKKNNKYVYDYRTLKELFINAGFGLIQKAKFNESMFSNLCGYDNRKNQMFYMECMKC